MIHDCFIYAGEAELLQLRLQTLDGAVDRFVIAEATRTFTGKPRKLLFDPAGVTAFASRIEYIVVDDLDPSPASAWDNEYRQRNALSRGLRGAAPDDWVILSDVDEIPNPGALRAFDPARYLSAVLHQRMYYYALNNLMVHSDNAKDIPWRAARITTVHRLEHWFGSMQSLRGFRPRGRLRSLRRLWNKWRTQTIAEGGWHFSYLMTPEQIRAKLEAFSHQELNLPAFASEENIRQSLLQRRDLFGGDRRFEVVPIDDSFPAPLVADPARYGRWIF